MEESNNLMWKWAGTFMVVLLIILMILAITQCSRKPMFDLGGLNEGAAPRKVKVVKNTGNVIVINNDSDNTLKDDTTYHLNLKGDTMYMSIKIAPINDTIK